ncbi:hypothetical protein [Streptococcus moroccensis]|uniref:Uncharacterized protein n=1 Tax=Streptococcus moroccensis TaxID=1451356 RepID=A0ABT9YQX2_9STRE|nr:hypothetical protein [Streptococcus moroccensis]MDQ0222401.1 hypothetical protein [Streptococcus moroccensis]
MTAKKYLFEWLKWFLVNWAIWMGMTTLLMFQDTGSHYGVPPISLIFPFVYAFNHADGKGFRWYKLLITLIFTGIMVYAIPTFGYDGLRLSKVFVLVSLLIAILLSAFVFRLTKADWKRWWGFSLFTSDDEEG